MSVLAFAPRTTRTCDRCTRQLPDERDPRQRYCSRSCRQRAYEARVEASRIDREEDMKATSVHALDRHICDGCSCGGRSPVGELVPDGWRRTLPGLLLCGNCYALRLTRLRLRNGYGSNA